MRDECRWMAASCVHPGSQCAVLVPCTCGVGLVCSTYAISTILPSVCALRHTSRCPSYQFRALSRDVRGQQNAMQAACPDEWGSMM